MKKYLLDTDICIYFLAKKHGIPDKIKEVGKENCFVSEITIAELFYGAEKSQKVAENIKTTEGFQQDFNILPIQDAIRFYAKEKARLRKEGRIIAEFDLLIASVAVANDMIMVTGNERHLGRVQGIKIENWRDEAFNSFAKK